MDKTKYIGMDVHKEAISIAVLNFSGKLVMECVIETKASTILQFFQGLRGSLHVTLEEGTWAAWLYDLLKPHVTELVVCNPRKNALLKARQQERPDRCQEISRTAAQSSAFRGLPRRERPAPVEGIVPQLFDDQQGSRAGDESAQGLVSELGHSLCRHASLRTAPSCRVARESQRTRSAPTGRTLLPATRRPAPTAPTSPQRALGRGPQA